MAWRCPPFLVVRNLLLLLFCVVVVREYHLPYIRYVVPCGTVLFLEGFCVCVLLATRRGSLLQGTTFFCTPSQLPFPTEFGHPFAVDMDKVPEEFGVPATELPNDRCLLYVLLSLGERLVGHFGSILFHDSDHVVYGNVRDLPGGQLTKFVDLVLQVIDSMLQGGNYHVLFLELFPHTLHFEHHFFIGSGLWLLLLLLVVQRRKLALLKVSWIYSYQLVRRRIQTTRPYSTVISRWRIRSEGRGGLWLRIVVTGFVVTNDASLRTQGPIVSRSQGKCKRRRRSTDSPTIIYGRRWTPRFVLKIVVVVAAAAAAVSFDRRDPKALRK